MAPIALASGAKLRACQVRTAAAQIAPGGAKCDFSPSDAKQWLRGWDFVGTALCGRRPAALTPDGDDEDVAHSCPAARCFQCNWPSVSLVFAQNTA